MKSPHPLISTLQDSGDRITPARSAIIEILAKSPAPLSVEAIRATLTKQALNVNKTTVYREIDFLLSRGLLHSVHLDDCTKYYELATTAHHHHVACTGCQKFVDVDTEVIEEYLTKLEKKLAKKINFGAVRHSLEFFGECHSCLKKKT